MKPRRTPSRHDDESEPKMIGDTIDATIASILAGPVRYPVNNREPREPIPPQKRALIHQRDGSRCLYCGTHRYDLVLDHIEPRSFYFPHQMKLADRSDNLQSACDPCNDKRSNYESHHRKRPGVVPACWECLNPDPEPDERPHSPIHAYCGRCGVVTTVPDTTWLL